MKRRRKGRGSNINTLLLVGVGGVAAYLAWSNNFLGIQDIISGFTPVPQPTYEETQIMGDVAQGINPQQIHRGEYPFPYPYYTNYPATAAPTTLAAAHYRIAGTPNLAIPSAAEMPNPSLWFSKGGIMNPSRPWHNYPYYKLAMGRYYAETPMFQQTGYQVQGTNISYPYLSQIAGYPSPCPIGEYRATDGRCYRLQAPPPEACQTGYYRASDGRCYPLKRW